jgi:hypothetical protein
LRETVSSSSFIGNESENAPGFATRVEDIVYRDVNLAKAQLGQITVGELNQSYGKIINLSAAVGRPGGGFSFVGHSTEAQLQAALVEVYDYMTGDGGRLPKKYGIIRRGVMGKAVDYAVRAVISAPRVIADSPDAMKINFQRTGVPLSQICVLFYPFIVKAVQDFIESELSGLRFIESNDGQRYEIKDPLSQFTPSEIRRLVQLYIKAPEHRFDPLWIKTVDGMDAQMRLYYEDLGRLFTLIDLLFIAATKVVEDKHVYITRYPVEHHQNIHPSKIHILSTRRTKTQKLGNRLFEDYPEVFLDYPEKNSGFSDTVQMSNSYLPALNGDYDGMQTSLAVFKLS